MVQAPDTEVLKKEAARIEEIEAAGLDRDFDLLSELSQSRVKDISTIPQQLEKGHIAVAAVKKFFPVSEHVNELMSEEFKTLIEHKPANYFVEVQDHLLTNTTYQHEDDQLSQFNE